MSETKISCGTRSSPVRRLHCHRTPAAGSSRGFALIISLVLMGMLVLLLLALGTFTQTETNVSEQQKLHKEAQANALVALKAALGQLQVAAGPDRRTTATLDIDSGTAEAQRYWTGVWRNSGTHSGASNLMTYSPERIAVLVSGENPLSISPLNDSNSIEIVGEPSAGDQTVRAPKVAINQGGRVAGNYAYWVGDQGVKANFAVRDRSADADNLTGTGVVSADERQAERLGAAPRYGIDLMGYNDANEPMYDFYPTTAIDGVENLDLLFSPQQFLLVSAADSEVDTDTRAARLNFLRTRFHDATAFSAGLLTDQRQGGLREDLSYLLGPTPATLPSDRLWEVASGPKGPAWELLKSYADNSGSSSQSPRLSSNSVAGIYPVLTQWYLSLNVSVTASNKLRLELYPVFVLHNPYNVTLSAADYRFTVDGSALALVAKYNAGGGAPIEEFGISFGEEPAGASLPATKTENVFEEEGLVRFHVNALELAPGQAVVLSLKEPGAYNGSLGGGAIGGGSLTENGSELAVNILAENGIPAYAEVELNLPLAGTVVAPSTIEWNVAELSGGSQSLGVTLSDTGGNVYQQVSGLTYEADPAGKIAESEIAGTGAIAAPNGGFAYILRTLSSQPQFGVAPLPLYANFNPRAHTLSPLLYSGELLVNGDTKAIPPLKDNDDGVALPFVGPFSDAEFDSVAGIHSAILFDANRYGLISLGQFQHLDMSGDDSPTRSEAPSLAFGNSFPDPRVPREDTTDGDYQDISYHANEALWDGYFFSTVPQDAASTRFPQTNPILANSRLRQIDRSVTTTDAYRGSEHAAASLLWIDGAFNVNSTSAQAWMALLASLRDLDGSTEGNDNILPRFVNSLGLGGVSVAEAPNGLSAAAWNSIRKLSDTQIESIAEKIVEEVRARGPFLSLSQFINRTLDEDADSGFAGPLQAALEAAAPSVNEGMRASPIPDTTINNFDAPASTDKESYARYADGSEYRVDYLRGAPGLLTQADILTLVGPVLAARSDTFVIRAYGDIVSASDPDSVASRAWCEAIVQRFPERVDGNGSRITEDADDLGRRFKIIHFRWLSEGEI